MPRYELGDSLGSVTFAAVAEPAPAPAADAAPAAPAKTDHKASFKEVDASGAIHFNVAPCDPATENPLVGIIAAFVDVNTPLPTTADEWVAKAVAKSEATIDASCYGQEIALARPEHVVAGQPYPGYSIHVYES